MRYMILCYACLFSIALHAQSVLHYVQPLVGTANSTTAAAMKHGEGTEQLANTIPAVGVPFGMTQWTPQTRTSEQKCLAPYYYKDERLSGFRGTHWLSGSCTQDYGSVTIMPLTGSLKTRTADFAATYRHEQETTAPDYYSVQLPQYGIRAEMTALARSSMLQFTMEHADSLYLLVIPNSDKHKGFVKIDRQRREITGYNPAYRIYQGYGKPAGFSGYFVVQLQTVFTTGGVFSDDGIYAADSLQQVPGLGAFVGLHLPAGAQLRVRVGTSFTSIAQARRNLEAEIQGWDFNTVRQQAAGAWEKALQQIQVRDSNERNKSIFYTALWHSMQHPRLFNDADGTYPRFAQQYEADRQGTGAYYDDFSMWDIYRAQLPLLEILEPHRINDMVRSLVQKGEQGGWLPIFPCWNNYTGAMVGDHAIAFIASAYMKGIRDYDVAAAYRLMRRNAFETPSREEYLDGKGRRALTSYLKYGFVPMEDSVQEAFHRKEQVSRTLEYAYDDYALACVAKAMGKTADYQELQRRAGNYRNVFNPATGFVCGRYSNGNWYTPFSPDKKLPFITEGTPRQYTFYVPQDIPGLATLMGGAKQLENALDSLFEKGEYWHGNEPGHQIPFLYNHTASPWKTQRQVRHILATEYSDGPGGLSGNDDAGQMSAWYVFGAIGLYPADPVSGNYLLCAPLFDNIIIHLPEEKQLEITVRKARPEAAYISSVKLNGKVYTKYTLPHAALMKGGRLEIVFN